MARAALVDDEEQSSRHDHAAHCSEGRQRRILHILQLAVDELAFDLKANHEEEQRHECVVHEIGQRVAVEDLDAVHREIDRGAPECVVTIAPWRVHPDQGDCRGNEQHDATGGLDRKETFKWSGKEPGKDAFAANEGQVAKFRLLHRHTTLSASAHASRYSPKSSPRHDRCQLQPR